jgi:hypothetical protein
MNPQEVDLDHSISVQPQETQTQYSNMKCSASAAFALLAAAATSVQAANIELVGSVMNSAAKEAFEKSKTLVYEGGKTKRDIPKVYEPDPNRDYNLEDGYIFVVQCTTVGFRPECISFGSEPGKCGMF